MENGRSVRRLAEYFKTRMVDFQVLLQVVRFWVCVKGLANRILRGLD